MATPFSAPDEAILTATVELSQLTLSATSSATGTPIQDLYDIAWIASQISRGSFERIALQFPDELLCDSSQILWSLQDELSRRRKQHHQGQEEKGKRQELFILADTSYGNCCVDEVAADHIEADLVVHFGHACLSLTSRLPVIYVFHKLPIDVEKASQSLASCLEKMEGSSSKQLVLMYDVGYEHCMDQLEEELQNELMCERRIHLQRLDKNVNFERYLQANSSEQIVEGARPVGEEEEEEVLHSSDSAPAIIQCKNSLPAGINAEQAIILYVGPESLALTNLLLRLGTRTEVISYDPSTDRSHVQSGSTNKLLQRRYFAVQKARDAQTVALLVGTLGLRSYLPLLGKLRNYLTRVQKKKVYTISVGKLNPAKLANFQEIDVFVLVACPENTLVEAKEAQRSKDFFRPIVTPFELMMAFKGRDWTGEYILDLETVFGDLQQETLEEAGGKDKSNTDDEGEDEDDEPHFSLITGGLVSSRENGRKTKSRLDEQDGANQGVVTVRDQNGTMIRVMDSAGGEHIASRSWRGLEPRLGMDDAAPLEVGRSGIAKGYVDGRQDRPEGHTE